jgi:hypothetical protein
MNMKRMRIQALGAGLAWAAWTGLLMPAQAARWTNGSGDHYWNTAANWDTGKVPDDKTDIVIDELAGTGPITANVGVAQCSSLVFGKPGGFTITAGAGFWYIGGSCTQVSVRVENEAVPYMIPRYASSHPRLAVAAGSTLIESGIMQAEDIVLDGPGAFRYRSGNAELIGGIIIRNNGLFVYDNWNGYDCVLRDSLAGTGTLACACGCLIFGGALTNLHDFHGQVEAWTPYAGSSWLAIAAKTNTVSGLRVGLSPWTRLGQRKNYPEEVAPPRFRESEFTGHGTVVFTGAEGGAHDYGSGLTNTMTACTLRPGLDGAGVLTFRCDPLFAKEGPAACRYICEIAGTEGTPGSDHDQIKVIRSEGVGAYLGGYVHSAGSAANPLADLDLVVDLSRLPAGADLRGRTLTILTARNNFTGAAFNSVTWIRGSGTVGYGNGSVSLADLRAGFPVGTILLVR